MTISNQNNRVTQVGNGSTDTIAIPFPVHTPYDDLRVVSVVIATGVETDVTAESGWTWSGSADSQGHYPNGGTITIVAGAWASTIRMVAYRDPDPIQELDLVEDDSLPVEEVEAAIDYLTMLVQRLDELSQRTLRQPDGDADEIVAMPATVERASKYLGFDAAGDPVALDAPTDTALTSAFVETLLDDANAGAFVETLVTALSALTAPAVGDLLAISDVSDGDLGLKITLANLFKVINEFTEDTTPDWAADFLATYDASASAAKKIKLSSLVASQAEVNAMTSTAKLLTPNHNKLIPGTVIATTSGGNVTLHSAIPAGVKRITVMFNGVSLSGTDNILIQIGDAGGVETTGYISSSCNQAGTVVNSTAGFILGVASAAGVVSGALTLSLLSAAGFLWAGAGAVKISTSATSYFAGEKSLTAELTQLIMVVTGVDTFDAGSVSILYER